MTTENDSNASTETPEEPPVVEETPVVEPVEQPTPPEEPTPKPEKEKILPPRKAIATDRRGEAFWVPKELAAKIGCQPSWIYEQCKRGKIKSIRQGRLVKISPEEAQRVLTEGLPLPQKEPKPVEAHEIVIEDERIVKKMEPAPEPKEEPDTDKGKPGWPLSILFK